MASFVHLIILFCIFFTVFCNTHLINRGGGNRWPEQAPGSGNTQGKHFPPSFQDGFDGRKRGEVDEAQGWKMIFLMITTPRRQNLSEGG